jgi:hypothetical protein
LNQRLNPELRAQWRILLPMPFRDKQSKFAFDLLIGSGLFAVPEKTVSDFNDPKQENRPETASGKLAECVLQHESYGETGRGPLL